MDLGARQKGLPGPVRGVEMAPNLTNSPTKVAPQKPAPRVHLPAAAAALLVLIAAVIAGNHYASWLEDRYVHSLAPLVLAQSANGTVLQLAAFRQPDLLPIYGSSEMLNEPVAQRAFQFFLSYPTGFEVFDIAKSADTSLDIAQDLAAVGPELKGKKVVVSFAPTMFNAPEVGARAYAENFSLLHANALAFSPYLSLGLKQQAAWRMLDYPQTLTKDPLLKFALENLAAGTWPGQVVYAMVFPLGQLDTLVIRMQDHYAVWAYLKGHPQITPDVRRQPQSINWKAVIAAAQTQQQTATSSDPYGIENSTWIKEYHGHLDLSRPGSGDAGYLRTLRNSREWYDLGIVLEVLRELGAQPLIMSRPINGTLFTAAGISAKAQQVYYSDLENMMSSESVPLVDFRAYTDDPLFSVDRGSHTSRKGWAIVDQALDGFYHGGTP